MPKWVWWSWACRKVAPTLAVHLSDLASWAPDSPADGGTVGSHLIHEYMIPFKYFWSLTEQSRHCMGWGQLRRFNYWPQFFPSIHIHTLAIVSMRREYIYLPLHFCDLLWLMKCRQKGLCQFQVWVSGDPTSLHVLFHTPAFITRSTC